MYFMRHQELVAMTRFLLRLDNIRLLMLCSIARRRTLIFYPTFIPWTLFTVHSFILVTACAMDMI